jgi:hypothetical protein
MSSSNSFSAGFTGCKVISNTSANTGTFRGFVVNDDAVVSAILDSSSTSILTALGLSGVTLAKRCIYKCTRWRLHFVNYVNKWFNHSL